MNIYVETYGCTANKSDERLLVGLVTHKGHRIVPDIDTADVLVLLTCTVIGTTEQRMLSRLKVFEQTQKRIIVSGCMPSVQSERITSVAPTSVLLPCQHIQYINDILAGNTPVFVDAKKTLLPKQYESVIAPVMIAEGCRSSCSYCITHIARGRLRSFPLQEIVADVQEALHQGCKEIQLTAQDTASYGLDTAQNLGMLLTHITALDGKFRIRVGMMNPATMRQHLESILTAYQQQKIYKFLHAPVQSGDNDILTKMNRGYSAEEYQNLIQRFRERVPLLTLSTDVIVGFPTESFEQFEKTIALLKKIQPDIVNITRFSARPLTAAKKLKGRIPTQVVKDRSRSITDIVSTLTLQNNKKHIGRTYEVLVTEKGTKNTYKGRTENYKQVVLTEPVHIGDFVMVEITDAQPTHLFGKLI